MFYGEFEYKIDDKGRVPVPPRFRNYLKDGMVLTAGAEKCIIVYTMAEWKKLSASFSGSSLTRNKMRRLNRALFATAFVAKADGQGRIALPPQMREHSQIVDDVVVAGVNANLEIWNKVLWEEERNISQEQAWQIIESLENR
jgi:MraZ protein